MLNCVGLDLKAVLDSPFVPADDSSAMKDVVVSVDMSKDSDGDSSKPSSKATSVQNSPAVQKGQLFCTESHVSHLF